jgi:putative transposase
MVSSKRWHADAEIAAKLEQGKLMAAEGKTQSEIAQALGISIMTYHRWRNAQRGDSPRGAAEPDQAKLAEHNKIAELQLENSRLRRLVTDLLLEKMQLQEDLIRDTARVFKEPSP